MCDDDDEIHYYASIITGKQNNLHLKREKYDRNHKSILLMFIELKLYSPKKPEISNKRLHNISTGSTCWQQERFAKFLLWGS